MCEGGGINTHSTGYNTGISSGYNRGMSSRPCPDGPLKGSRLQLRSYLQKRKAEFDGSLQTVLHAAGARYSRLEWVSPIQSSDFAEYRDGEALRQIGLSHLETAL